MSDLDSNDLECRHCGATFYYELTHCPKCGHAIYPSDFDDSEEEEGETEAEGWGINPENLKPSPRPKSPPHPLGGILMGSVGSNFIAIFLFFILENFFEKAITASPASLIHFIPLASVPLGAILGGYVAMQMNQDRPLLNGISVGLLSLPLTVLLTAYQYDLATEPFFRPETLPWWAAILLAAILGSYLPRRVIQTNTLQTLFTPRTESQLYTDLLTKVQFDRPTAESLIAYEQNRAPHATRFEWIQNAIDRWERDNRTK